MFESDDTFQKKPELEEKLQIIIPINHYFKT